MLKCACVCVFVCVLADRSDLWTPSSVHLIQSIQWPLVQSVERGHHRLLAIS